MSFLRFLVLVSIAVTSLFVNFSANASQQPRFLGTEKKFRSFVYNPNEVYRYLGHYTYQGFIEFDTDETIGTISMGDPSLWLFEHLGNRLFLKPVGEDNSETNMTVITNKKIYHFELTAKEASSIDDAELIFVAKFSYPDEEDKNIIQFAKAPQTDIPDMRNLNDYNFNYQYTGEPSIAPSKVFDNGEFTYFQFPSKSAEIPAIFTVDSAGFESLVNFRSAGNYIIVERMAPQFTLRSGADIVCVYNSNMYVNGKVNSKFSTLNQSGAPAYNPTGGYAGSGFEPSPSTIQGVSQETQLPPFAPNVQ
jgi:type IV secretion system protein VirB9